MVNIRIDIEEFPNGEFSLGAFAQGGQDEDGNCYKATPKEAATTTLIMDYLKMLAGPGDNVTVRDARGECALELAEEIGLL